MRPVRPSGEIASPRGSSPRSAAAGAAPRAVSRRPEKTHIATVWGGNEARGAAARAGAAAPAGGADVAAFKGRDGVAAGTRA